MQACRDVDRNAKMHVRGMLGNAMVCVAVVEIGNVVLRWQCCIAMANGALVYESRNVIMA